MVEFPQDNPRLRSNQLDPRSDPVHTTERPLDYRDLLSDRDFAEQPWNTNFGTERYFYLTGVADAMRLLQEPSATFLKTRKYLDDILGSDDLERWAMQSGVPLDQPVKRERAGEIVIPRPTYFHKCVKCMVAFELAFERSERLKGKVSKYWVYDYMRIVPAIYNLRGFSAEKLSALRRDHDNFNARASDAMRQPDEQVLDDLAGGHTVTRLTASRLKRFVDEHCSESEEHRVGEVRTRPGSRGLGNGLATTHELVEPGGSIEDPSEFDNAPSDGA